MTNLKLRALKTKQCVYEVQKPFNQMNQEMLFIYPLEICAATMHPQVQQLFTPS